MTRREQMIECAGQMEQGMIRTQTTRDIWQNDLIWWLCKAVKLLLTIPYNPLLADSVDIGGCESCIYSNRRRPQKFSCCRRNRYLKDCYEED